MAPLGSFAKVANASDSKATQTAPAVQAKFMKQGTQADHYRGTTTMAIGLARGMRDVLPHVEIDDDTIDATGHPGTAAGTQSNLGFEQPGRALQGLLEIIHGFVGQSPLGIGQPVEDL